MYNSCAEMTLIIDIFMDAFSISIYTFATDIIYGIYNIKIFFFWLKALPLNS